MTIVQINTTCGVGSTGKICAGISDVLNERKIENYILYSRGKSDRPKAIKFSDACYTKLQALKSRVFGNYGFNSQRATKKLILALDALAPDVVHIHNIHGHDCNIAELCEYLKKKKIKVVWTFHDCWVFTAYCPHFVMAGCDQWKTHCRECPQHQHYSWFFDRSSYVHSAKKAAFDGLDLTIVTPSKWLARMVGESCLKNCPTHVVYSGIDLHVFKPTDSDFRQKYHLEDKKIVLGVAFDWGLKKGLDVFTELAKTLPQNYVVVLVGTNAHMDRQLPENVVSIHRTQKQTELAEIYTAADVFVNPTREEVLGLTNIEANACGTPVVTFDTGGSPECIDTSSGIVVKLDDVQAMAKEIRNICEEKPFDHAACCQRAKQFEKNDRFAEYVRLYETINP